MPAANSSAADSFVHLHVHTEYSMLDGAARVTDLVTETARMGMPAVAMTDHGNVFGAYDFWKRARAAGVKPIIGMEGYLSPGSRFERKRAAVGRGEVSEDNPGEMYTHMTLLATSTQGMHNLFRLSSLASLEGHYYKPRMDRELLEQYGGGLVGTTGCPSGEVNRLLQRGNYVEAKKAAADYQDIFGRENFFCELMDHGIDIERNHRDDLLRIAKDLQLPLLATNDLHYTYASDAQSHEVLLCVQTGKTMADTNRFKLNGDGYYLKSPAEMRDVWRDFPEACDNTLLVAERCEVAFTEGADLMPRFPIPAGETAESFLVGEVERGLAKRFPAGPTEEHRARAAYELGVITAMGFPGYFLVVADLVRHARESKIRVGPGRGSAGGSVVAYALGITELDPVAHGLLFERFLNPERISMPDIDLDFDERRRGDMIRYATELYGEERVAQIITYGTIKAKQAIKDSSRVLGFPYALGDRITKALPPPIMGKDISLESLFDPDHKRYSEGAEFRALYDADVEVNRVVETARGLEGLKRQWGVHAAGVILSAEPLLDVIPIMRREQDGAIITQFDMGACESLGLLKMDFLGLRNLTVLDDTLAGIKANRGSDLVLETLPLEDRPAFELLSRGDTLGVFQLDGGPMRALLRRLKPDSFEDISAVLALYRPGPMGANAHNDYADRKNGRQQISAIHPELEEPLRDILDETFGVIVYQEQVLAIAQKVAGYSLGKADLLRKAMGKKKREILDAEFGGFEAGMQERGYGKGAIKALWDILVPFSDYAFNKAHTTGYGLVSFWTAYLKANYPAEYMGALLTSVRDDKDKSALYLNECRRMGIKVLPPDVNTSAADFTPTGTDIRFGLAAIRNVGANVVAAIVRARETSGRFADFADFLRKVDAVACNKRVVESLIKAGAFDSLGHTRRGLIAVHLEAVDQAVEIKRNEATGQFDLFGGSGLDDNVGLGFVLRTDVEEWDKKLLLAYEREMLGLYVSDHPLLGIEQALSALVDCSVAALDETKDGQLVTIGGLVTGLTRKHTRATGEPYAVLSLEDLDGAVEVFVFPAVYRQASVLLAEDVVVVVKGRVRYDDGVKVTAMDVLLPDLEVTRRGPVVVALPVQRCTPPVVDRLREVLRAHPGTTDVHLRLLARGGHTTMRLDPSLRVAASPALMGDLKALLGPSCLQ